MGLRGGNWQHLYLAGQVEFEHGNNDNSQPCGGATTASTYRTKFKYRPTNKQLYLQNRVYHCHYRQYTVHDVVPNRNYDCDNV